MIEVLCSKLVIHDTNSTMHIITDTRNLLAQNATHMLLQDISDASCSLRYAHFHQGLPSLASPSTTLKARGQLTLLQQSQCQITMDPSFQRNFNLKVQI
jgi:hypothetical protein